MDERVFKSRDIFCSNAIFAALPKRNLMAHLKRKNREKIRKFAHILAAVVILLHAFDKFEINDPSYPFYTGAGLIFLLMAIFHEQISRRSSYLDSAFMIIEAAVYAMVANEYFHAGKQGLPWAYVMAAVAYIAAAFISSRKSKKRRRRKRRSEPEDADTEVA